jgi:hypothetical protein
MKTIFSHQPSVPSEDLDGPRFWIDDTSGKIMDGSPGRQRVGVEQSGSAYSPAAFLTQLSFRFAPRQGDGRFVAAGRAVCACSNPHRETSLLARGGEP